MAIITYLIISKGYYLRKLFVQLLSLFFLMLLNGCEDKKHTNENIPIENTTVIVENTEPTLNEDERFKLPGKHTINGSKITAIQKPLKDQKQTFILTTQTDKKYTVNIANKNMQFIPNEKPIVLVRIFATWCIPCLGNIEYMNDLQDKYKKELFIASVLTHDTIKQKELQLFIAKHHMKHVFTNSNKNDAFTAFVAQTLHLPNNFSIPLTIMYVKGKYFTHYEGATPIEMIEYDIEEAKKQLQKRSK